MLSRAFFIFFYLLLMPPTGCGLPLDLLGNATAVTEKSNDSSPSNPEDDRIEDKNPKYDPSRIITEGFGEDAGDGFGLCHIQLNKSATVTKLDIAPLDGDLEALKEKVFPDRGLASEAVDQYMDAESDSHVPSLEVVNGALKPFNDGLYASIELGVQNGITVENDNLYPSKKSFLLNLLETLTTLSENATSSQKNHVDEAMVDIGAALILAGESPSLPGGLGERALAEVEQFEESAIFSKPIGFYTWNKELEQIFAQDRYLQNYKSELNPYSDAEIGKAAAIALALEEDAALMDNYNGYLALYKGLTNPFMNHPVTALLPFLNGLESLENIASVTKEFLDEYPPPSLPSACQPHMALFPSSKSKETMYFESKFCGGAPSNVNYMDELIIAIRDGLIDLRPGEDSGWYDYQSWALETLLLPERGSESNHLLLTKGYKKKLMETFKSIMTQNRETHVKQVGMGSSAVSAPAPPVDLYPNFPVEPFPTFYLRSARAYRFLATYLEAVLGMDFLNQTHRLADDGWSKSELNIFEELRAKAEMLYGLHIRTADAVGMKPELMDDELAEYTEKACRERAVLWLAQWRQDSDVLTDPRVIVPVQRDGDTDETIYWAVLGVKVIKTSAEFVKGYEPRDIEGGCWTGEIVPRNYFLLVEAFSEIRIPSVVPPPTRLEFREICDDHDTVADIVAALEAL